MTSTNRQRSCPRASDTAGRPPTRARNGFSLVELMVAMVIGLILLAGVVRLFIGVKQSYRHAEQLARMQENGRYALHVVTRGIRMADFWGCLQPGAPVTSDLDPLGPRFIDFAAGGLAGRDDSELPDSASDTVTVRGAFGNGMGVARPGMSRPSSDIVLDDARGLEQEDFVAVSDCRSADVFQISNPHPNGSDTVAHRPGQALEPGNRTGELSRSYGPRAELFQVRQLSFSIAEGSDGTPALYRRIDDHPRQAVANGIERLQILYGEDDDGDASADYYVPAHRVVDMNNVVSARVALVARSLQDNLATTPASYTYMGKTVTTDDRRLRQVFQATVSIRNRLR